MNIPEEKTVVSGSFKQDIAAAVMENIRHLLGETGTRMIFHYSGVERTDLSGDYLDEVYDKLGNLIPCLRRIFGPGAMVIEEQIAPIIKAADTYRSETEGQTLTARIDRE